MRIKSILTALAVLFAIAIAVPQQASAGLFRHDGERVATHRVHRKHHHHHRRHHHRHHHYRTHAVDPYHYRYKKPRYYPAYNSGYWIPARHYRKARKSYRLPTYYQAWGYPKRGYNCKHRRHGCKHYRHHRRHHHHRHW